MLARRRVIGKLMGLVLWTIPCLVFGQLQVSTHAIAVGSSEFEIDGRTNLSSFQCSLREEYAADTLLVESVAWTDKQLSFGGLTMTYPVASFQCAISPMTKELHETLNASAYPHLTLVVKDITVEEGNSEIEKLQVGAHVSLTLAGVSRDLVITDGFIINESGDALVFGGSQQLLLSDFNLEPPRKMMGLVRVMDQLLVSFRIAMRTRHIK